LRQSDLVAAAGVNGFCQWINCRHGDTDLGARLPGELSGGQGQRVAWPAP
jgi:ABC-type thiamine transport system ATPase subunit